MKKNLAINDLKQYAVTFNSDENIRKSELNRFETALNNLDEAEQYHIGVALTEPKHYRENPSAYLKLINKIFQNGNKFLIEKVQRLALKSKEPELIRLFAK